jgi:hypothetical protein
MRAGAVLLALALVVPVAVRAAPPAGPAAPVAAPVSLAAPVPLVTRQQPPGPAVGPAGGATASMRTGDHPGFGRVVFELPAAARWTLDRAGDRLTVRFTGADPVAGARPPRNVRSLTAAGGAAELVLAPGAQVRPIRMGNRLVLDLLDPAVPPDAASQPKAPPVLASPARPAARPAVPAAKPPVVAARPAAASASARLAAPLPLVSPPSSADASRGPPAAGPASPGPGLVPSSPAVAPAVPPAPPPVASALPVVVEQALAGPVPAGPVALAAAAAGTDPAILLPFAAGTAAAAFRRGDQGVLVFDERRPIDVAALHADPVFGAAEIRLFPGATVLRFGLPAGRTLRLARGEAGWTIRIGDDPTLRPIRPDLDTGSGSPRLRLPAGQAGRSVVVPDPLTGVPLLVGTQREPGQGIAVSRSTPEFTLLPTWQGVAVAAISDALVLHEAPDGFVLASAQPRGGLALAKPDADLAALDDAMRLTRRFDFPALPVPALLRRLQSAVTGSAAAPAGMRTAPRIATAQAMLALGLGAEAQGLLSLAVTTDPRAADDPDLIGLSAIAALLAGRTEDSAGLDDPRLTGTDEVVLWRGLRAATLREGAPDAAAVLAAEFRLLLAYPSPLKSRLLPLAAETMALGGEAEAAQRLIETRPDDTGLDFARALLAEKRDRPAALAILDRLAQSPDRLERARAAPRAVELRLAGGEITPAAAADAMEKLLFAWRGDAREVALRLRVADLRAQSGAPRAALALLREAAEAMPEARDALRARMAPIFAAALAADAKTPMPPLDLVALAEENPDLIAEGEPGLALATRLADRLAALDLPRRAAPVLEKLVAAAAPGVVRAELGGRLAATRLLLGDTAGALSALSATAADSLPPPVLESRVMVWASATAAQGDATRAAAALEALDTPAAMEQRGELLEKAKDWKGATAALRRYADRIVPAEGALTEAQAGTLLRLAAVASQAGDSATLEQLRGHDLARLPQGRTADMLRLLTATPVQLPEDLPRARREATLASGLLGATAR